MPPTAVGPRCSVLEPAHFPRVTRGWWYSAGPKCRRSCHWEPTVAAASEIGVFIVFEILGSLLSTTIDLAVTKAPRLCSISDMLRAANHAGIAVCDWDCESGLPKRLPLYGDPRSNVHRLILRQGTEPPICRGSGVDPVHNPRSPANRGWGCQWGWTPDPRQIGGGGGGGPPISGRSGVHPRDGPPIVGVCRAAALNG